jgi:DNA recombination protein RmuC
VEIPILVLVILALAASVGAFILVLRQAHALQALRLLAEQTQAGLRAENETTRNAMRAGETSGAERLAGLKGALDVAAEQIRTALSRDQGALRLALAEGQAKSVEQTGAHFETVRKLLDLKLRELREGNEAKLAEIHKTVNEQLHAAVEKQMGESFNRVIDQFTAVQKAMGDVQAVTAQIGDIKRLFSNVKTRGGWGETQVRAMLDDILPPGAYETNKKVRPDSDDVVEFAVIMPMRGENRPVLPIDSKFPIEDYERLLAASDAGDVEAERGATRMLERRVREEARKIAAKYIAPPVTVEFAILYLPTDALYAEVARIPGLVDDIGRECRVLLMGPTLFPALLRTIHLGFVTLALEHKADQIRDLLGATRTEMLKMDDVLERLAKQAGTFSATIDRARVRTRAVGRKLRGVEQIEAAQAESLLELGGVATVEDLDEMEAESIEAKSGEAKSGEAKSGEAKSGA